MIEMYRQLNFLFLQSTFTSHDKLKQNTIDG